MSLLSKPRVIALCFQGLYAYLPKEAMTNSSFFFFPEKLFIAMIQLKKIHLLKLVFKRPEDEYPLPLCSRVPHAD